MRGSSGPFQPANPSVTVRAVRHYWWEAELASSVERHLHTLWPRGRGSLKLAAHCLQHHLPPSLRELPKLQGHRQDPGGTIGTVVLLGVSCVWLLAACGTQSLVPLDVVVLLFMVLMNILLFMVLLFMVLLFVVLIFKIFIFGFPWPFIIGPGRKNFTDKKAGIHN